MAGKTEVSLSALVRAARQQREWSLRQMSKEVAIPVSTLGKIETGKLSLPYDKLQQLTSRLGLTMTEFLSQPAASEPSPNVPAQTGRKSVTNDDTSIEVETKNYHYRYLCTDLQDRRMIPVIVTIRSHSIDEFGGLVYHKGEEFIYVIQGKVEVITQFYMPIILSEGQGIYLDSSMGHAYVTKDCEVARVLAVNSSDDPRLAEELLELPKSRKR